MNSSPRHLSVSELEAGLPEVLASPREAGRLELIVVRPDVNERRRLATARLTPAGGVDGDRWATDPSHCLDDGRPDPDHQVSLMNVRILRQIAAQADDAMCLAGDNLVVDLDLSEANLPTGSRLAVGEEVVIEITGLPHTGCGKFARRYGDDVRSFINGPQGRPVNLRGRYARVVQGGSVAVGQTVRKLPPG